MPFTLHSAKIQDLYRCHFETSLDTLLELGA
jgi:hypothetical protein